MSAGPVTSQTSYLIILVSCHCDEFSLGEDICPEGAVRQFQDVIRLHYMKSWLVFVHGVENCLQMKKLKKNRFGEITWEEKKTHFFCSVV